MVINSGTGRNCGHNNVPLPLWGSALNFAAWNFAAAIINSGAILWPQLHVAGRNSIETKNPNQPSPLRLTTQLKHTHTSNVASRSRFRRSLSIIKCLFILIIHDTTIVTYRPQYHPLSVICYLDVNPLPTHCTLFITLGTSTIALETEYCILYLSVIIIVRVTHARVSHMLKPVTVTLTRKSWHFLFSWHHQPSPDHPTRLLLVQFLGSCVATVIL
jgi:hypothetical protein